MIKIEHAYLTLGGRQVLNDVSFDLDEGDCGVMLGASGSGKTTMLRLILGLFRPDEGSVYVWGEDITKMDEAGLYRVREKMGMVFQGGALFDSQTVGENVGYRLIEKGKLTPSEIESRVRAGLRFVGLEDSIDLMPAELSGGMKKRVAIARGIAAGPKLMLFDEPTAGLDPLNTHNIVMLIKRLRTEEGVASVVVTHDIASAYKIASKIAFIDEGRILYNGSKEGLAACGDERVRLFLKQSCFAPDDAGGLREVL